MKVKKNYYYLLFFIFLLISFTILFFSGFFSKLNKVVNFVKNKRNTVYIVQDSTFNVYIKANQYKIDVTKYTCNLDIFPYKGSISMDMVIKGKVLAEIDTLILNFEKGYNISSIKLNNNDVKYIYKDNYLSVINKFFTGDSFNISIKYYGQPTLKGLGAFVFDEYKGNKFIYTLNEPIYASSWLPCNDRPDDKAYFDISISSDSVFTSLSNGRLVDIKTNGKRKTYYYHSNYPISTYLMCVYSGKYYYFEDYVVIGKKDTVRLPYYTLEQNDLENFIDYTPIKKGIKVFSELFGTYPFVKDKYGNAEITWLYGAIEHQTITGLSTSLIKDPIAKQSVFIHELAHSWWGNAVGVKTWKDIWLNEGFATYSEALYAEKVFGKEMYLRVLKSKDGKFDDNTLYAPKGNMFSGTIYNKGAWVLHMLRNKIGDKKFFDLLKYYYNKYNYSNASTNDFIEAAEKISGEELKQFFNSWVFKGTGIVNIEYNYKIQNNDLYLNINLSKNKVKYFIDLDVEIVLKDSTTLLKKIKLRGEDTLLVYNNIKNLKNINIDPNDKLLKNISLLK